MNKELQPKIEELFRWNGTVEIKDTEGNVVETLYQRVVGDADIQRARLEALKASKLMRKALKDPTSDEAIIHLPLEDDFTKEELITLILFNKYYSFQNKAEKKVEEKKVKEPKSDASLEEQENYIDNIEKAKQDYKDKVDETVRQQSEAFEAELREKSDKELYDLWIKENIELICRGEMIKVFDEYATYFGTFSDEDFKNRRFETVEDFKDLAPRIKNQLMTNYKNLELGLIDVKK